MCKGEGLPRLSSSQAGSAAADTQCGSGQGQGLWRGLLCPWRLFTQQRGHETPTALLLGRQLQSSAFNYSSPRGLLKEVTRCLAELALMLGIFVGPLSTGFSAGAGGTGACQRSARRGKQHVPCLHLPRGSRQPRKRRLEKPVPSHTGELAAPSGSASVELCEELPRAAGRVCGWCAGCGRGGGAGGMHVLCAAGFLLEGASPSLKQPLCPRMVIHWCGSPVCCWCLAGGEGATEAAAGPYAVTWGQAGLHSPELQPTSAPTCCMRLPYGKAFSWLCSFSQVLHSLKRW